MLPETLASFALDRIVTSPHARCVETVRGLALARGLPVELRDELLPDAPLDDTWALLVSLPEASLACTHREVFQGLFGGAVTCEKGAAWILEREGEILVPTAYLPSPTSQERAIRPGVPA